MNTCKDKIKMSCPPNLYANCVRTEAEIPEFSTLSSQCNSVQEVETDMYTLIGGIKEEIDVTSLINGCITFTNPKTSASVIVQLYAKLCDLETTVATQAELIADLTARVAIIEASPCV